MSDSALSEDELQEATWPVEGGLRVWCEVQRRAGATDADTVGVWRAVGAEGSPAFTVPLNDVEGLAKAYVAALPGVHRVKLPTEEEWLASRGGHSERDRIRELEDARNAPLAAWAQRAGALLAIIGDDGERRTACLALDGEILSTSEGCSVIEPAVSENTIRMADGRVQIRQAPAREEDDFRWIDALAPAEDDAEAIGVDVVNLSGLSTLVAAAGGRCWFDDTPSVFSDGKRRITLARTFNAFRMSASQAPVAERSPEADVLRTLAAAGGAPSWQFGMVRLTHMRELSRIAGDESAASRVEAVDQLGVLRPESLAEAARALPLCGGDWSLVLRLPGVASPAEKLSFVTPGLIPAGMPTLFVGAAEAGKSTALHDLALIVATPMEKRDPLRSWLGVPASEIAHGTAILLSGEDIAPLVAERQGVLAAGLDPQRVLALPSDGRALTDILRSLRRIEDLTLLVVDPALKYLIGSSNDDGPVNEFFNELEVFARSRRCAVVVAHHFKKAARAVSLAAAREAVRGSQMWIDRPRAVIALLKSRGAVDAGIIKWNVPPSYPQARHGRFRYDKPTLRLWPMGEAHNTDDDAKPRGAASPGDIPADTCPVVDAVRAAIVTGKRVTRTGKHGVYEQRLGGHVSRRAVQTAVDVALQSGALMLRDGSLALPGVALPPLPNASTALPVTATTGTGM